MGSGREHQTIEIGVAPGPRVVDVCFVPDNGLWPDMATLPECANCEHEALKVVTMRFL
jgi:hypothetical protein